MHRPADAAFSPAERRRAIAGDPTRERPPAPAAVTFRGGRHFL
jgi:hypothetical protein